MFGMDQIVKKILFQPEITALGDLQQRLAALEAFRDDPHRFEQAVSRVLTPALRAAQEADHERLAQTLAPVVVGAIKAEIRNSRDEMVEALHPLVGRLVRAAVAQAVAHLDRRVQAALPFDRWMAQLRVLLFGGSALSALAKPFTIEEALLIDRQTGALIERRQWGTAPLPDAEGMAAILAAILTFAETALADDGVRQLELHAGTVYLRVSGVHVLALRSTGQPPADFALRLDVIFERLLAGERVPSLRALPPILPGQRKASPLRILASGMVLLAAVFWLDAALSRHQQQLNLARVQALLAAQPQTAHLVAELQQGSIILRGVVPDAATAATAERLARLQPLPVIPHLLVLEAKP